MEDIIKIKYKNDFDRLKETYISAYGATNNEYLKELDRSITDSMRNFEAEFDNEKVIIRTVDKNEKNTYFYKEIYKLKKTHDSYLFFINKLQFYFFKFSDFSAEDLKKIDNILKVFYEKTQNEVLAVIEDYELTEKRVTEAGKTIYKSINIIFALLTAAVTLFHQLMYHSILITFLTFIAVSVFLFLFLKFYYKSMGKRIIKSTNKNFLYARILFYTDKIEIVAKKKMGMTEIRYNEFYKIKKTKKGYLFLLQKYSFYFFFYNEFKDEELKKINNVLSKYM
jgi:hypothetical protein